MDQAGDADVTADDLELALRLVAVLRAARGQGRFNLEQFLLAAENDMGGTLLIENPCKTARRQVVEMRYASEGLRVDASAVPVQFIDTTR